MSLQRALLASLLACASLSANGNDEEPSRTVELNSAQEDPRNIGPWPAKLRCDACLGVSHQMLLELRRRVVSGKKYVVKKGPDKGKVKLSEEEYHDAVDFVCNGKHGFAHSIKINDPNDTDHVLNAYGIMNNKEDGSTGIVGPGTPLQSQEGAFMKGGTVLRQMIDVCGALVSEHSEDDIFTTFFEDSIEKHDAADRAEHLCSHECNKVKSEL